MVTYFENSFKLTEKLQEQYNEWTFMSLSLWFTSGLHFITFSCALCMYVYMSVCLHGIFLKLFECILVMSGLSSKYLNVYFLKTRTFT